MTFLRRCSAFVVAAAMLLVGSRAQANEGTVKRYVMPFAAALGVLVPRPAYYLADSGQHAPGIDLRAAPVSFVSTSGLGEIVMINFIDLDVVLDPAWTAPKTRGSLGLRTQYYPFRAPGLDLLGVQADYGLSIGFGGPSVLAGGGLVFGGKMASIGLSYRRGWGRDDSIHTFILDFGLTYPSDILPPDRND